jgi:hypothetical protein
MSGRKYCGWPDGCKGPVEAPGRRFCTPHRQAHGRKLESQLQSAVDFHHEALKRRRM